MARFLIVFVAVALMIYAFIDVLRSDPDERAGVPKVAWAFLVLLLPVVGAVGWLIISAIARAEKRARSVPTRSRRPWNAMRTKTPDDDVTFLNQRMRELKKPHDEGLDGPQGKV